jgi:hypothetical protein
MSRSATIHQVDPVQGLEYMIYVFKDNAGKWEKNKTLSSLSEAQQQADVLFKTGQYQKVEIKQKFFDKKKNRNIDTTLKVLEQATGKRKREIGIVTIALFAVICGALAFAATWFFNQHNS